MTLTDLSVLYAMAGLVSSVVVYRAAPERGKPRVLNALMAVPLWPLWLPVVLASHQPKKAPDQRTAHPAELSLVEAFEAVRGTPLEGLLPKDAVERIQREIRRASERHRELEQLLQSPSFDLNAAHERLARLEKAQASQRTMSSARLHLENIERLASLAERDRRALEELAELVAALRTQLVLARYAGSSAHDAGDIVLEVLARVEALGTTIDSPLSQPPTVWDPDAIREARIGGG